MVVSRKNAPHPGMYVEEAKTIAVEVIHRLMPDKPHWLDAEARYLRTAS